MPPPAGASDAAILINRVPAAPVTRTLLLHQIAIPNYLARSEDGPATTAT